MQVNNNIWTVLSGNIGCIRFVKTSLGSFIHSICKPETSFTEPDQEMLSPTKLELYSC